MTSLIFLFDLGLSSLKYNWLNFTKVELLSKEVLTGSKERCQLFIILRNSSKEQNGRFGGLGVGGGAGGVWISPLVARFQRMSQRTSSIC